MLDRQIGRPIPIPPCLVVKNLWNSRPEYSGLMPGPLTSATQCRVVGSDMTVRIVIVRFALSTSSIGCIKSTVRLTTAYWIWIRSPRTCGSAGEGCCDTVIERDCVFVVEELQRLIDYCADAPIDTGIRRLSFLNQKGGSPSSVTG